MNTNLTRQQALDLLLKYNKEPFHIQHALTVEAVMKWFANKLGHEKDADYWAIVGLLHDLDFEMFPDEHCKKVVELLTIADSSQELINSICSHGYGICSDIQPQHIMEKVLFASDELTGLIGAIALMRPSKSVKDMNISSIKKKFKNKKFAAGCSRDIISQGAFNLEWELDYLFEQYFVFLQEIFIYY